MTLPDSSAWIEYIRGTGSPVHLRLRELVAADEPLLTSAPVMMELLAGAAGDAQARDIRRLLARCDFIRLDDPGDFESAADIFRRCRAAGTTVRGTPDCLIAALAIRVGAHVLHRDADFESIARCSALECAPLSA